MAPMFRGCPDCAAAGRRSPLEVAYPREWIALSPDRVFVPVGSGDGVYGIWKGFRELATAGAISRTPRMIACQASGADSTVRAFHQRSRRHESLDETRTVALSIAEKIAGDHALRAIYESEGEARAASDEAPGETWVLIGTGAAVKWPDYVVRGFEMPPVVKTPL
jgi:threonine synthase